jgi:integrase
VVRRILNLCARLWRDELDRPWLDTPPLIQMQRHPNKREPYPLAIDEQRLLFSELAGHLVKMALLKVNTGLREQEVVNLRWVWEVPVPELDTSVFVIPRGYVKNGLDRYVVLNRVAKSVIDGCRGEHPVFVFTRRGKPITRSIARDGEPRVVVPRNGTRARSGDPVQRDFDRSECMI